MRSILNYLKHLFYTMIKKYKDNRNARIIRNNEIVYCVIQRKEEHFTEGLFACFLAVIKMIYEAKERGMIPVIDMMSYKNPYLKDSEVGKINAWEIFFQQPSGISLNEINGKKNVIYMYEPPYNAFPSDSMEFLTNQDEIIFWRDFCRKNIRLSDTAEKYIKKYDSIVHKIRKSKMAGVYLRGSDYVKIQPVNHAVVPDILESIKKVRQVMNDFQCTHIFLSVEDSRIQKAFEKEFTREELLYIDQKRFSDTGKKAIVLTDDFLESDVHETGLKYLAAVYLVSQCTCFVAARCCGSIGALLLSEGFEYAYFWNKGRYKLDHLNQPVKG